jgi:hypothetical protein
MEFGSNGGDYFLFALRGELWNNRRMTRQQVLDMYFMDARCKLIELAAFLDRVDRAPGEADFRLEAFRKALAELQGFTANRAEQVLLSFSDPSTEPILHATTKGACGAFAPQPAERRRS